MHTIDTFVPYSSGLLCRAVEPTRKSAGGLHLPEQSKPTHDLAEVVRTGPGSLVNGEVIPVCARPGDVVVYRAGQAEPIEIGGERLLLIREHQLAGLWPAQR